MKCQWLKRLLITDTLLYCNDADNFSIILLKGDLRPNSLNNSTLAGRIILTIIIDIFFFFFFNTTFTSAPKRIKISLSGKDDPQLLGYTHRCFYLQHLRKYKPEIWQSMILFLGVIKFQRQGPPRTHMLRSFVVNGSLDDRGQSPKVSVCLTSRHSLHCN